MTDEEFATATRYALLPNGHTLAEYEEAAGRLGYYGPIALQERDHQRAIGREASPSSVAAALAEDLFKVLRDILGSAPRERLVR